MGDRKTAAKVGLLVVALATSAWALYRFVDERAGQGDGYTVWALFPSAQGLAVRSRVVVAGIAVGYIESIELQGRMARVDIAVRRDIVLYHDAFVAKQSASLLGESLLVIDPGTRRRRRLQDGDRISTGAGGAGTDEVLENVNEIAKSIRLVAKQFERSLGNDRAGDKLAEALDNVSASLKAIRVLIDNNDEAVSSTLANVEAISSAAGPKILAILENVEQATGRANALMATAEGEARPGSVQSTLESIERSAKELEEVVGNVHEVTERTARGEGTVGRLTKDEALIDEVEGVVEGVGSLVGGLSRLQTIVSLRTEYNVLANSFKSYLSLRLQAREDAYFFIQLVDDPRGRLQRSQSTVRRSPPPDGEPAFYQETRTETTDSFRFSLMFAKRVHFATLRFGILESSGGIGADLHALDDRLELNLDMFALGEQIYPRFRARLSYEVVQRLWLLSGVDDVLNANRDMFFGAMLRFNDEDLKTILPFVGVSSLGGAGAG